MAMKLKGEKTGLIWEEKLRMTPIYLLWLFAIPLYSIFFWVFVAEHMRIFWSFIVALLWAIAIFFHNKIQSELTKVTKTGIYGKISNESDFHLLKKGILMFDPKFSELNYADIAAIINFHEIGRFKPKANFCSWRVDIHRKNGKIDYLYLSDLDGFKAAITKAGLNIQKTTVEKVF